MPKLNRTQLVGVILFESLLLYAFLSLAIDSGAMLHYAVAILLLVAIVQAAIHLLKSFQYQKNDRPKSTKKA
jgi:heme/copper-type cytochrome/quinol oxidase subunit 4